MCPIGHPWQVKYGCGCMAAAFSSPVLCYSESSYEFPCLMYWLLNCPSRSKGLETAALERLPPHLVSFYIFFFIRLLTGEETPVPEWVQRELSHTGGWHPSVLEAWYPSSNACGASPDLMESFRYISETYL